jgi:hypothetical protein
MSLTKLSRRDRIALIAGSLLLLILLVFMPGIEKAHAYRKEQLELLEEDLALLQSYEDKVGAEDVNRRKYKRLKVLVDELPILTAHGEPPDDLQTQMIADLNQLSPGLTVKVKPLSLSEKENKVRFSVSATGRYEDVLKFLEQLELYRPLTEVDALQLTATKRILKTPKKGKKGKRGRRGKKSRKPEPVSKALVESSIAMKALLSVAYDKEGK